MREIIKWVSEALAAKDIGPAMTHYSVAGGLIRASNGKITAAHPWPDDAEFLVSGMEFEKVLARMEGDEPTVTVNEATEKTKGSVTIRSGRFHATIDTLPVDSWLYPGVDDASWLSIPKGFVDVLRSLRAFISDNPAQAWAGCVALEDGNCYATNNIAVAGCACAVGGVQALLPAYAVDFLLRRVEGLESWAWSENYVAFKWSTGAWVRSQLVIGKFPERAASLVREAYDAQPTQEITDEFRAAFADVAGLAEDTIHIYGDRMESKFKRSVVVAPCECEVPLDKEIEVPILDKNGKPVLDEMYEPKTKRKVVPVDCSIWGAAFLAPVISQATHWQPSLWPKPAPFRGENVAGFIVGRKE
jgi:predicted NUDIX family NTP pyrophosphohydrolase